MAVEEVVYKKSYIRGDGVVIGSFPVTISGPLKCVNPATVAAEKAWREHVLSEEPDNAFLQTGRLMISLSGTELLNTFDNYTIGYFN